MQSKASTVEQYLAELPADRRAALEAVRAVFRTNLDPVFQEGMQYGMIGYFVPHSVFPQGYHCDPKQPLPFAGLASQKNAMSLYLFCLYQDASQAKAFEQAWSKTGKKLDMGKSCIRFKAVDDLALDVIADTLKRMSAKQFIAAYLAAFGDRFKPAKAAATKAPAKTAAKKPPAKKTTTKKAAAKKSASKKTAARAGARSRTAR